MYYSLIRHPITSPYNKKICQQYSELLTAVRNNVGSYIVDANDKWLIYMNEFIKNIDSLQEVRMTINRDWQLADNNPEIKEHLYTQPCFNLSTIEIKMIKADVKILLIMMKEDYAAAYDFNEIERVVSVFLFSWIDHMDTLTQQIIHTLNDINNNCLRQVKLSQQSIKKGSRCASHSGAHLVHEEKLT
ncbi:MAG: hypothetical protein K6F79_00775 [Saccharofermentans sp.]|nr:hypothetical protein [Saccharofermentans sp.]